MTRSHSTASDRLAAMPLGIAAPPIGGISSESDSEGSVHPRRAETDIAQHPAQRPTVLPDIDLRSLMCRETDRDAYDAAWSALHQRFAGGIYVFVQERVRDTALTEIVCADVWCAASEELTAATDIRSVASWIYRRAEWRIHNVWAQASRDARLFVQPLPECVPDHLDVHDALQTDLPMDFSGRRFAAPPDEDLLAKEWCERAVAKLVPFLRDLPPSRRQVFELYFVDGQSAKDVGDRLNRKPGAIRTLASRLAAELRAYIASVAIEGPADPADAVDAVRRALRLL